MKTPTDDPEPWPDPAKPNSRPSVLSDDLVVEGDVVSSGSVDVQGQIQGSVRAPDVVISVSGRVKGLVSSHNLFVLGAISGTISARNVQLAPSAVVRADIVHARIAIEAGADLEGRLQRKV